MKLPKSIYFIVSAVFPEMFTLVGVGTTLSLYLVDILQYSKTTATSLFHAFFVILFSFGLVGSMMDSWLGLYRAILYLRISSVLGSLLLLVSSITLINLPARELSMLGLLLLAVGVGGVMPCNSMFGGEQLELSRQKAQLPVYAALFFVAVHTGSLVATFTSPLLRKDVTCFDKNSCYSLVFLATSVSMTVSVVIFVSGRKFYKTRKPKENVAFEVAKCISLAIRKKMKSNIKRDHWLDHADSRYDRRMIKDVKTFLNVIRVLSPLLLFWSLHAQKGSRWTFQATYMDGEVFGYLIKPDQFNLVNPLLVIISIPIFQMFIYPFIERFLFISTHLRKLTVAGLFTVLSFVSSGIVELNLEETYIVQPSSGLAQIRIFNTINCSASVNIDKHEFTLRGLDVYQNFSIPVKGITSMNFSAEYDDCQFTRASNLIIVGFLQVQEAKAISWVLTNDGLSPAVPDRITKSRTGDPLIRALISSSTNSLNNVTLKLEGGKRNYNFIMPEETGFTKFIEVNPGKYDLRFNNNIVSKGQSMRYGGVYTIVGHVTNDTITMRTIAVIQPNSIHIFWQLPQYIFLTFAEVIMDITGIQFKFTQSPQCMRSMTTACWFIIRAIGNVIVIVVTQARLFEHQSMEFFLYATFMSINMLIFILMAKSYKYVEISSDESVNENLNQRTKTDQMPGRINKEGQGAASTIRA